MAKTFEVIYQPGGAATGRTVNIDVFKPDKTKDTTQSGTATEVGTTGRYHFNFDAEEPGWFVEISDNAGGKACKHFGKPDWDAHGVGDAVATVAAAVVVVNGKVDAIDTQLDTVESKIDALQAPPMVG